MKPFLLLLVAALTLAALPAHAQTTDPAKVAALHEKFMQGLKLAEQAKPEEALAIFDSIIKDEPKAKGSLYYAGLIAIQLNQPEKAIDYLNRFHAIDPDDYKHLVLLIQANQMLGRDIRVEEYRKSLYALHNSGKPIPGLTDDKAFPREKVFDKGAGETDLNEYFDPKADPQIAWELIQRDDQGRMTRHILLAYNKEATDALRKSDPKLATAEVWLFGETVIKDGKLVQYNLYRQEVALPSYSDFRKWALDALKNPPKPIAVHPMGA
ncbi:Tetratricopeptide repeat-containing protein [Verrucomicrobium sp. GAS474]|uniref:tetratricopeptide repeat protein n=1 Tax=Verrucomicrobium sp. GAS474 TaxID=1882831 RepID=UPI00087D8D94|nr:tetratricopeptide repeat protein [Verrucomicrobium sp. GAS474]SDU06118.1 Tetratricopeptide repeat-containing protein [Verrucomicrobium sp. GAS474]